jgi:hypothetical protein
LPLSVCTKSLATLHLQLVDTSTNELTTTVLLNLPQVGGNGAILLCSIAAAQKRTEKGRSLAIELCHPSSVTSAGKIYNQPSFQVSSLEWRVRGSASSKPERRQRPGFAISRQSRGNEVFSELICFKRD